MPTLSKFRGINNFLPPTECGPGELQEASGVYVDDFGAIVRRPRARGTLAIRDGAADVGAIGFSARSATLALDFAGDSIRIRSLRVTDGDSPRHVAEASGLMFTITNKLLRQAAAKLRHWQEVQPRCWPLSVTINISPKDFAREDHLSQILSTLMRLKMQAHGIRLEITESQLMEDTAAANRALTMIADTEYMDTITPMGWHLVLHLDAQNILEFNDMLNGLKLPFIIDHMGRVKASDGLEQEPFRILLDLMKNDEKAWVKVCGSERVSSSGPPFHDSAPFAAKLIEVAPDRCVWGTDWPHPHHAGPIPDDGQLVDVIAELAPTEELRRKLMADNPVRLYERRGA